MKESDINITRYCINAGKTVMSKETVLTESQFFIRTKSNSIELFIASISSVIVFTVSTVSTAWWEFAWSQWQYKYSCGNGENFFFFDMMSRIFNMLCYKGIVRRLGRHVIVTRLAKHTISTQLVFNFTPKLCVRKGQICVQNTHWTKIKYETHQQRRRLNSKHLTWIQFKDDLNVRSNFRILFFQWMLTSIYQFFGV